MYGIKRLFGCYKTPLAIQTTVSGFRTAVLKPVALMQRRGGMEFTLQSSFLNMILMDVNFRKCVKRYPYICLSRYVGLC